MATCSVATSNSNFRHSQSLEESRNRCARPYHRVKPRRYVPVKQPSPADGPDPIVTINISGCRYETHLSTLNRFPSTLLGDPHKRMLYYDYLRNEFFFERNRKIFSSILEFYQTGGILRRPDSAAMDIFMEEVEFFELPPDLVKRFLNDDDDLGDEVVIIPENGYQRKIWCLLEQPNSSKAAQVIASFNILVILLAVINYSVETLPEFRHYQIHSLTDGQPRRLLTNPFFIIETVCNFWFCSELLVRFAVNQQRTRFFLRLINAVDLMCIIPYFVDLILLATTFNRKGGILIAIQVLRIFRLLRIFRIFKLTRYSDGLNILWMTMKSARDELGVLCLLFAIGMTICSATVYYAEFGYDDTDFRDIPSAFWWTVITWATVGYGDLVPKHGWGKIVGAICSTTGVVCLGFIVPIIVAHFEYFFNRNVTTTARANQRNR